MATVSTNSGGRSSAKALAFRLFNRPLLAIVGLTSRTTSSPTGPILVVQLHKIGDFVVTTPLIRALAQAFPERTLVLAVSTGCFNLAETCPYASRVVSVPTRIGWTHTWANIAAVRRASAQVAALKPSIAVDPRWSGDLVQEALMVKWSGAARRIGFSEKANSSRSRQSVGFDRLFTDTHLGRPGVHESRQMLLLLDLLNMPAAGEQTELWLTEDDATVADSALASSGEGRGWVAISPGAGRPNRCWSPSRFAVVASALAADGWQPVVIGGPEDRAAGEVVAAGSAQARNLVGRLTLRQTAAVLTRCRLLVANDSAPAHLATAVRTPVVELSTHPIGAPPDHDNAPERWAPLGTVLRPMALAGCEMGCVADSPHCINGTDAQDVIAAARQLLAANPDPLSHNGPGTATS